MYNEVIKKSLFTILTTGLIFSSSCGNKKNSPSEAELLLTSAQEAFDNADYNKSIILLDSLTKSFPTEIDTQRKGMHLKTVVDEKKSIKDSISNDSIINIYSSVKNDLSSKFIYIKTKDMVEGYSVHKNSPQLINRTGVEARIDDSGAIYLVSLLNGHSINHTKISFSNGASESFSDNVPFNGSTNYRFKDSGVTNEMVTFRGAKCDTLCQFVSDNANANLKLNFIGKSRFSIPLSKNERNILAETQKYSVATIKLKKAEGLKLYYLNRLKITREQIKKTSNNL
ncbi:MAG: hypothetical protein PHR45_04310 [Muribaculaceae bacterium]|nr:hypothetical protein [Muribaculaceae bacterium]